MFCSRGIRLKILSGGKSRKLLLGGVLGELDGRAGRVQSDHLPSYAVSVSVVGHKLFWVSTSPGRSSAAWKYLHNPSGMGQAASALGVTGELSVSGVDFESLQAPMKTRRGCGYHAPSSSEYVAGDNASFVCSGGQSGCGSGQSYAYGIWNQSLITKQGFIDT